MVKNLNMRGHTHLDRSAVPAPGGVGRSHAHGNAHGRRHRRTAPSDTAYRLCH